MMEMRQKIDRKIERIMSAIEAVETLAEESELPVLEPPLSSDEEQGFTDQIRSVFRANSAKALTAIGIRDLLVQRDRQLDPKITLIHTHNTLKRLVKQEEIVETQLPEGRTGYRVRMKPVVDLMAALKESLAKQRREVRGVETPPELREAAEHFGKK